VEIGKHGAWLVLMGRDKSRVEETAALIGPGKTQIVTQDLTNFSLTLPAIMEVVRERGRLYGLCHCAGVVETLPLAAMKPDNMRGLFDINVTAGLELARVLSRRDVMTPEGGSIVFVSSIYGSVGMAGQIGYSATKGALIAASRAMAVELARRHIRVNTLSPGLVHTRLSDSALSRLDPEKTKQLEEAHPLGPGTPEDVARAAAFLLAPEARWITGIDLIIDGGFTAR
jgi:NAD(P)-dependent dehydrogenase (short-subunit alcohol dehydrogenase family)